MGGCRCYREKDGTFVFKSSKTPLHYLFLLSDICAFVDQSKKPLKIRENYPKAMKMLLENPLDELQILLRSGDYFKVEPPILNKKPTEPKTLKLSMTVPKGEAIKVYSIDGAYVTYIINRNGKFIKTSDYKTVVRDAKVYF